MLFAFFLVVLRYANVTGPEDEPAPLPPPASPPPATHEAEQKQDDSIAVVHASVCLQCEASLSLTNTSVLKGFCQECFDKEMSQRKQDQLEAAADAASLSALALTAQNFEQPGIAVPDFDEELRRRPRESEQIWFARAERQGQGCRKEAAGVFGFVATDVCRRAGKLEASHCPANCCCLNEPVTCRACCQ